MQTNDGWINSEGDRVTFDLTADTTLPAAMFHRGKLCDRHTAAVGPCYAKAPALGRIFHPVGRPC